MSYQVELPKVFPHRMRLRHQYIAILVKFLLNFDPKETPNGSSFAFTSDTMQRGYGFLWVSNASYDRLVKAGYIEVLEAQDRV